MPMAARCEDLILATLEYLSVNGIDPQDRRGRDQHRRVRAARKQYRVVPARHRADVPRHGHLALWSRSAGAADLRGAAAGARRTSWPRASACSRSLIKRAYPRQPAPHHRAAHRRSRTRPPREARRRARAARCGRSRASMRPASPEVAEQTSAFEGAAEGSRSARSAGQDPDADARGSAAHQQGDPDRDARSSSGITALHARSADQWRGLSRSRSSTSTGCPGASCPTCRCSPAR